MPYKEYAGSEQTDTIGVGGRATMAGTTDGGGAASLFSSLPPRPLPLFFAFFLPFLDRFIFLLVVSTRALRVSSILRVRLWDLIRNSLLSSSPDDVSSSTLSASSWTRALRSASISSLADVFRHICQTLFQPCLETLKKVLIGFVFVLAHSATNIL